MTPETFWHLNRQRGDSPCWQRAPIPEAATQAALLHLVQGQLRAQVQEPEADPQPKRKRRP